MYRKLFQLVILVYISSSSHSNALNKLSELTTRRCSYTKKGRTNKMCYCYFYNSQQHIPLGSTNVQETNNKPSCQLMFFIGSQNVHMNSTFETLNLSPMSRFCGLLQEQEDKLDNNDYVYTLKGNKKSEIPPQLCNTSNNIQTCCFSIKSSSGQSLETRIGRTGAFFVVEVESIDTNTDLIHNISTNNKTNGTTSGVPTHDRTVQLLTIFIFGIPAIAMTCVLLEKIWLLCRKKLVSVKHRLCPYEVCLNVETTLPTMYN